ncbi:hypothetical protein I601_2231 [Nocardioides dokdonensis FR1436]|uniref:HipA-like C-terminal domain-containing protein n=1 Tax=Nocardioides dokdonensis FR1436 TaxID=1300347 RepID=A0A1A9GKN9_9ACTN|nr:hypothetical protein [Nocardioides dokdonensis]ANH38656.1 hypothetical protein I601_2231 [Nocardioides dokdonensis FR1436]
MTPFPGFDVTDWLVTDVEPVGDDIKYWLRGAAGEPDEASWLFKQATVKEIAVARSAGGGYRLYRQGEDWAEKVCSELASLIALPAARVELAERDGVPGLISRDTKPRGWSLNGGGVLLSAVDPRYKPKSDSDARANRVGHNLDNIERVLLGADAPPWWPIRGFSAFDLFAGFLLFDAWVANRDRHEFNWAVLQEPEGGLFLSPSFDHGAALASGLEDERREAVLARATVSDWCAKGTAHRFEDCGRRSLLDVATDALLRATPTAREFWIDSIVSVEQHQWEDVLNRVPSLSAVTSTFTAELLRVNQERIRDEFKRRA